MAPSAAPAQLQATRETAVGGRVLLLPLPCSGAGDTWQEMIGAVLCCETICRTAACLSCYAKLLV